MINNPYLSTRRAAVGYRPGSQEPRQAGGGRAAVRRAAGRTASEREAALPAGMPAGLGERLGGPRRVRSREIRRILDVDVTVAHLDEAIDQLVGCVNSGWPGVWGFCNAHTANVARHHRAFREALGQMIIFNDGVGVDVASRVLHGRPFPENLNGTDLTPQLLERLPAGTPVFLLGSPPGVAEEAALALEQRHGIRVAGTHHGFFAEAEEEAITAAIAASGARLVLVGMGHPRQELWAARHARKLKLPILCVGAFLDFSAGRIPRAPAALRALRLEWLYRLILEPRRMARRYVTGNACFLLAVLRQRLFHRRQG